MSGNSPVCLSIPETTFERIRAALLIAASSAEERAFDAAGSGSLTQVHIPLLPLSKRRAVEGFLADRAECLTLLGMMESGR
jgi:hypothetical protein